MLITYNKKCQPTIAKLTTVDQNNQKFEIFYCRIKNNIFVYVFMYLCIFKYVTENDLPYTHNVM